MTEGNSSNTQPDSRETISAPGNVTDRRRVNTMRNWLVMYGLGRSRLKKGKNATVGNLNDPTTPRPAKPQKSSPEKSHATKPRWLQRDQRGVPWQVPRDVLRRRAGRRNSHSAMRGCLCPCIPTSVNANRLPLISALTAKR